MQLWTEYEGRTIAGAYTLGKLLRSEGRNGFFATADATGTRAVIRITEAHYDEDELLNRWRQVTEIHEDNLIEIGRFGQTNFDGVAITYALMEADDANLADVLRERPLTLSETTQVGRAVHAALSALHASGLVHEHIAPDNVLAVGDSVKLRSDCVRECIADIEFNTPEGCAELRRRDIQAFGMLLLECLTLEKRYNPGLNLPDFFRRLIPHMLDGTWSLDQIGQVLNPAPAPTPIAASSNGARSASAPAQSGPASPRKKVAPQPARQGTLPLEEARPQAPREPALRSRRELADEPGAFKLRPWVLAGLAAVIVCIIVIWHFVGARPARPAGSAASTTAAPLGSSSTSPLPPSQTVPQTVVRPAAVPTNTVPASATNAPGWYVIAWTYNHQGQAQAKADQLNARHHGFHAEVFSPHGRAPFLISLGGPMSEPAAKELQQRARRSGLPRDTFIRNYR